MVADKEVGAVSVVGSVVVSIVVDREVVSILVVGREIFSSVVVRGDIDVVGMAGHITSAPASESSLRDSFYFQTVLFSSNSSFKPFTLIQAFDTDFAVSYILVKKRPPETIFISSVFSLFCVDTSVNADWMRSVLLR